ncbi:hypothetical protein FRX31_008504 [Thalictrum thalictroides]|uniref:Uncharacterized protein n=1 Tax=Thalictrum thalictroides TaxID=46969 RepID=A0A7J6WWT8_THATH|nr:hypothetical protein FRX31_008504 [Thalictrum thalictroides]
MGMVKHVKVCDGTAEINHVYRPIVWLEISYDRAMPSQGCMGLISSAVLVKRGLKLHRFTRRIWDELLTVYTRTRHLAANWISALDVLQTWPEWKSKELAAEFWGILPYAVIWTVWKAVDDVVDFGLPRRMPCPKWMSDVS